MRVEGIVMYEEYEGGEDLRAQSHVHRRRSAKRMGGIPYPSDFRDNAYKPVEHDGGGDSVLSQPTIPLNGMTLTQKQRMAFGQPTTGAAETDLERRMYGIYNR